MLSSLHPLAPTLPQSDNAPGRESLPPYPTRAVMDPPPTDRAISRPRPRRTPLRRNHGSATNLLHSAVSCAARLYPAHIPFRGGYRAAQETASAFIELPAPLSSSFRRFADGSMEGPSSTPAPDPCWNCLHRSPPKAGFWFR